MNKDMDAVYLLSPLPHIVDCLMADLERRRYGRTFLIWTSGEEWRRIANLCRLGNLTKLLETAVLPPDCRSRLDNSAMAREQIAGVRALNIDFYPRESHLITFRDPWSFPMLFHPACNQLVRKHMDDLAQKVAIYTFCYHLRSGAMLSIDVQDSFDMCIARRVPDHTLSQSSERNTRSRRVVFASCPICANRARQVRPI